MGARGVDHREAPRAQRIEHIWLNAVASNNHDAILHVFGAFRHANAVRGELFDDFRIMDQRTERIGLFIVEHSRMGHIERSLDPVANAGMLGANDFHSIPLS